MVGLDNLEFSYHDSNICDLRLSPEEVDLVIPRFILRDRQSELEYWGEQMKDARSKMDQEDVGVRIPDSLLQQYSL